MRRPLLVALGAAALIAVVIVGLSQTKTTHVGRSTLTKAQIARDLAGSPPALATLHGQANTLLGGGPRAVKARIAALKGHPLVINVWGSWCGPCRTEFPLFQNAGARFGKRVAFLGIDVADNDDDARGFLRQFPVTYPSYIDGSGKAVLALKLPARQPLTLVYDARGNRYVHQGPYTSDAGLAADIRRYALH